MSLSAIVNDPIVSGGGVIKVPAASPYSEHLNRICYEIERMKHLVVAKTREHYRTVPYGTAP